MSLLVASLWLAGCGARTSLDEQTGGVIHGGSKTDAGAPACAPTPKPKVLYASSALWGDLIGDGHRLYVQHLNGSTYDVQSVDSCTGDEITLGQSTPLSAAEPPVVPFDGHVYWVNAPGTGATQDLQRNLPLGGPVTTISSLGTEVEAMAFQGSTLFAVAGNESLFAAPIAGGTHTMLATDAFPTNPIVDGQVVYYARSPGGIGRVPTTGGPVTVFPPKEQTCVDPNSLRALVADAVNLYTITRDTFSVWRVPKDGSSPALLTKASWCSQLALDDTHVYFTTSGLTNNGGSVNRVSKAGGSVETVAPATNPWGIYVDATSVYWIEFGNGELMKVDK